MCDVLSAQRIVGVDILSFLHYNASMRKQILAILIVILLTTSCSLPHLSPGEATQVETSPPITTADPNEALFPDGGEPPPVDATVPTPYPTAVPVPKVQAADWAIFIGDYETALQAYQEAVNDPDAEIQVAAWIGIGRVQYLLDDPNGAITTLNSVIDRYPYSTQLYRAYYFLGLCYESLGNYAIASDAYNLFLLVQPGLLDAAIQEKLGDSLSAAGRYDEAIQAYQAAIEAPQLGNTVGLEIKIGLAYLHMGDNENAVRIFLSIYDQGINDTIQAQMNLLAGQAYENMGLPEQAYARYQDSVLNYPKAYDSYTGLVHLVNAEQPVDELQRGMVDYYAWKYGVAIDAFNRYLADTEAPESSAYYYKGLSHRALEQYEEAIQSWQVLIELYPEDSLVDDAWEEIATTEWYYLGLNADAVETLLNFVDTYPASDRAPEFIYYAARVLERDDQLAQAAETWERIIDEYPEYEDAFRALQLAGIQYYRKGDFVRAMTTFQRLLLLTTSIEEGAAAQFWIGKVQMVQGNTEGAYEAWRAAAAQDPTGYYSERAEELLEGKEYILPFL